MVDAKLFLTDGTQTVPADNTLTISENIIDLGAANADPGEGRPTYLNVEVSTAIANAGALTTTFTLYEHTAATSVTSGNALISFARPKAELGAGTHIRIPLPIGIDERYLGLAVQNSAGSGTTGAFRAWLDLG